MRSWKKSTLRIKEMIAKEMKRLTTQEIKIYGKGKGGNLKKRYVCLTRCALY